jgi:deoxyuridine 5'-triphosphate nucleotidohydrolase
MIQLGIYALREGVELPVYGTSMSTCFDLSFNPGDEEIRGFDEWNNPFIRTAGAHGECQINSGDRILVPTGIVMQISKHPTIESFTDIFDAKVQIPLQNYSIRLHARSGLSLKRGLVLANAEGVVDVDYQQEVFVMLWNISKMPTFIKKGDRIAQAEVVCNVPISIVKLNSMPQQYSERSSGFGSTGITLNTETPPMEEWQVDGPTNFTK